MKRIVRGLFVLGSLILVAGGIANAVPIAVDRFNTAQFLEVTLGGGDFDSSLVNVASPYSTVRRAE